MVFLFIRLHGIERLVSTALEQGFFFFLKNNLFPVFSRIRVKLHFPIESPIPYFH